VVTLDAVRSEEEGKVSERKAESGRVGVVLDLLDLRGGRESQYG
jgi:hypothetical protein